MLNISVQFPDDRGAAFYPQHAAVQSYVIILSMTPFPVGIEAVVGCAALVLQALLGRIAARAILLDDASGAAGNVGVDEHAQAIGFVAQNVICTAADDNAGTLLCEIQDHLLLNPPEVVLEGMAVAVTVVEGTLKPVAADAVFATFGHILLGETALFGDFIDQIRIVAGDPQLCCNLLADGASAAAELSADGDDPIAHFGPSSLIGRFRCKFPGSTLLPFLKEKVCNEKLDLRFSLHTPDIIINPTETQKQEHIANIFAERNCRNSSKVLCNFSETLLILSVG